MKTVMVFGAFDGLHPGHLDFFRQARNYGEALLVSVGTDRNVEKIKGKKPLFNQDERMDLVSSCKLVDRAVLGEETDFYFHIKNYLPDVICLGYDQWAKEADLRTEMENVGVYDCEIYRLQPYEKYRAKSTIMKEKSVDLGSSG